MTRIDILDSVRGLMSWWVAIAHALMMTNLFKLPKVLNPAYAVDVFIILSGFVITLLLAEKKESYIIFIVRRGFRLLPVYIPLLLISAYFINEQITLLTAAPFQSHYLESRIANLQNTLDFFWTHFILHLTLLQGLVSSNYLPSSDYAFIEPAWSLSLEWQFYLIAPIITISLKKAKSALWVIALSLFIAIFYGKGGDGLLSNEAHFFFVGIVSYYIYKNLEYFGSGLYIATIFLSFALIMRSIPLIIWASVFATITNRETQLGGLIYRMLNHKLLMYFGKISFPIYIVHTLVMHFSLVLPYFGSQQDINYAIYILCVSIIGTWLFSHILHVSLELTGINLGRKVSRKLEIKGHNK